MHSIYSYHWFESSLHHCIVFESKELSLGHKNDLYTFTRSKLSSEVFFLLRIAYNLRPDFKSISFGKKIITYIQENMVFLSLHYCQN